MKVLKIGRSSTNDVILNESTVSSQHAILTIETTNSGISYHIKDLNSTNGTFVNGVKIKDAAEVKAGDSLKFGNYITSVATILSNAKNSDSEFRTYIPSASEIKSQKTIGRQQSCDISFPHQDVSSNHAVLIKKNNGETLIVDKNSTNGTFVNGRRVSYATLKAGDKVLISNKYQLFWEIAFNTKTSVLRRNKSLVVNICGIIVGILLLITLFVWAPWKPWSPGKSGTPEEIYAYYNKTAVLICQTYYFEVEAAGEKIGDFVFYKDENGDEDIAPVDKAGPMGGFGTGFFVSSDGKIITNRHVMNPNMTEKEHISALKQYFQMYFEQYATAIQNRYPSEAAKYRNAAHSIEVSVCINSTGITPNDTYVTSYSDFQPCTILGDTGSEEIDLGLIQLNTKELPNGVTSYVNLSTIDEQIVEGKEVYTIGFPWALTIGNTTQGVEAQKQTGHITQVRGNVQFGHNLNIEQGSSGSPIFSEKGHLIGVVNAGFLGASGNFNIGIQAKYALELLNKYN